MKILHNFPTPIIAINPDTSINFVNPALEKFTGFSSTELVGCKIPYPYWRQDMVEQIIENIKNAMHYGAQAVQEPFQNKNGEHLWVEISSTPIFKNEKLDYFLASYRDITDRKHAEKTQLQHTIELEEKNRLLLESEQRFQRLTDASFEGIIIHHKGKILDANNTFARLHGYTLASEVIGRKIKDFMAPGIYPKVVKHLTDNVEMPYEAINIRNDGATFPVEVCGKTISYKNKKCRIVAIKDITDKKNTEDLLLKAHQDMEQQLITQEEELNTLHQQLLHSEKLAAIGRLSASIAHEFNNPLNGIQSVLEGVQGSSTLAREDGQMVKMALDECERVRKLIRNLLDFNAPSPGKRVVCDIHEILKTILSMCTKDLSSYGIQVQQEYLANSPFIQAVPDQIKQVLLNLMNNARDAMQQNGGLLTIHTEQTHQKVIVSISDTGLGIDQQNLPQLFEPFFTTKSTVTGTGLGLSVSHGIIKNHGGTIDVKSISGEGSTFSITLPIKEY